MGAFDKLKDAVGYSGEDSAEFAALEHFVQEIEAENTQLRMHAVAAIQVAEEMREENTMLVAELTQSNVNIMVGQAAELDKVTHAYDQEVMQSRVAQAEAVLEEVVELRTRVGELEEENTGLTEMLNEMRQSQQQLNRLQMMEQAGENTVEESPTVAGYRSQMMGTPITAGAAFSMTSAAVGGGGGGDNDSSASPSFKTAEPSPMPDSTPTSSAYPHQQQMESTTPLKSGGGGLVMQTPTSTAKDPVAVAQALSAVAGGAEGGVAAAAARMLRDYAEVQTVLEQERESKRHLEEEVHRLNEITSAKTFKAPSAWAERELKYRQEKQDWNEAQKEADVRVEKMRMELETLRGTSGAIALERRIEELEARLLESERDRDVARATLHDMEITSRASVGEFSLTGKKPYRGPRFGGEDGEMQQVISGIESSGGGTPRSQQTIGGGMQTTTPGMSITSAPLLSVPVEHLTRTDAIEHLTALQQENVQLRSLMQSAGVIIGGGATTTPTLNNDHHQGLSDSNIKKVKDIETQLVTSQQERAELMAELQGLRDATVARGAEEVHRVTLQLHLAETETRTEVALLQHGVDSESARELAALAAQLEDAQQREHAAMTKLEMLAATTTAAAAATTSDTQVQEEQEALENVVYAVQEEVEKIHERIREVAVTATVVPELLHTPPVAVLGDDDVPVAAAAVESLSEEMTVYLKEAVAVAAEHEAQQQSSSIEGNIVERPPPPPPPATISTESAERIRTLQIQLKAAEQALSALETGSSPVQMLISVAEAAVQQQHPPHSTTTPDAPPVSMRIAVTEGPTETKVKLPIRLVTGEEAVASIFMPINISSSNVESEATPSSVHMPINIAAAGNEVVQEAPVSFTFNVAGDTTAAAAAPVDNTRVQLPINITAPTRSRSSSPTKLRMAINVAEPSPPPPPPSSAVHMPINISGGGGTNDTAAAPVQMAINVAGDQEQVQQAAAHYVHMPLNISEVQPGESVTRVSVPITIAGSGEAPVQIPITIAADPLKEKRMKQLEELLQAALEEEERLRRDLNSIAPVKLNLSFADGGGGGKSPLLAPGTGMSRRSSAGSIAEYTAEGLANDRAAADAAWQDHVKSNTDMPSLLRSKAELETKCAMLQTQLDKMQGALAATDREKEVMEKSIEDAMREGDVGVLAGLREGLKGSRAKMMASGRNFKVFGKKKTPGTPEKEIRSALHVRFSFRFVDIFCRL